MTSSPSLAITSPAKTRAPASALRSSSPDGPGGLVGRIKVPGDKSISHRALIFAGLAIGQSRIKGLLEGEDVMATAQAMRALGATISRLDDGTWLVQGTGVGGLTEPAGHMDMGNSGTAVRLLAGLLATHDLTATFTGDASLSSRPMNRVFTPIRQFGAQIMAAEGGRLPFTMRGTAHPLPITYTSPVPSAQVKSAVLLAGLNTPGHTVLIEAEPTRDHTEIMLHNFGAALETTLMPDGKTQITLNGPCELTACDVEVPGDPSSAAFPIAAALMTPGSDITVENVAMNPGRTGLFTTLLEMGADLTFENERTSGGEKIADIRARYSRLKGVDVPAARAISMIDEYPVLSAIASIAHGTTRITGAKELRVKESDRIKAMVTGLAANGASVTEQDDGMTITGTGGASAGGANSSGISGGANVETFLDHRIAMSFAVLGLAADAPIEVNGADAINTSFPGFIELMNTLGANMSLMTSSQTNAADPVIIAIDGPAASGKGTLARALASHLGLHYLDTGTLYRAIGLNLLEAGGDLSDDALATKIAQNLDIEAINDEALRTDKVSAAASIVAVIPGVRDAMLDFQRKFAARLPGAILDGRDIGTVVCPDALVKFYVSADAQTRAHRRFLEFQAKGMNINEASVLADVEARDARDAGRAHAPLKPAEDAHLLDTSNLSIEAAFRMALQLIEQALPGQG